MLSNRRVTCGRRRTWGFNRGKRVWWWKPPKRTCTGALEKPMVRKRRLQSSRGECGWARCVCVCRGGRREQAIKNAVTRCSDSLAFVFFLLRRGAQAFSPAPWISVCPGEGRLPSLLTHNPLQTPPRPLNPPNGWQLYCQKGEKTSSSGFFFPSLLPSRLHLPVCVAFPPSPPSRTCQTKFRASAAAKLINCATQSRVLILLLSGFVVRVTEWKQIKVGFYQPHTPSPKHTHTHTHSWLCGVDWYATNLRGSAQKIWEGRGGKAAKIRLEKTFCR